MTKNMQNIYLVYYLQISNHCYLVKDMSTGQQHLHHSHSENTLQTFSTT